MATLDDKYKGLTEEDDYAQQLMQALQDNRDLHETGARSSNLASAADIRKTVDNLQVEVSHSIMNLERISNVKCSSNDSGPGQVLMHLPSLLRGLWMTLVGLVTSAQEMRTSFFQRCSRWTHMTCHEHSSSGPFRIEVGGHYLHIKSKADVL